LEHDGGEPPRAEFPDERSTICEYASAALEAVRMDEKSEGMSLGMIEMSIDLMRAEEVRVL